LRTVFLIENSVARYRRRAHERRESEHTDSKTKKSKRWKGTHPAPNAVGGGGWGRLENMRGYLRERLARVDLTGGSASSGASSLTAGVATLRGARGLGAIAAGTAGTLAVVARERVVLGTGMEFCSSERNDTSAFAGLVRIADRQAVPVG
jgi:hypothetical protein